MNAEQLYHTAFLVALSDVQAGVQVAPVLAVLRDDALVLIPVPRFTCVDHKNAVAEFQRDTVKLPEVACCCFVCEAWAAKREEPLRKDENLEFAPDRYEVVLFNLLTKDRRAVMNCRIDRERATLVKEPFRWLDEIEGMKCSGRFIDR